MDEGRQPLKIYAKIALAALGLLVILSLLWYKEKVCFADASYVLFDVINYRMFDIQFNRYGSFITQLVPYLGFKLHAPIGAILIGYAVSFHLFYLAVASLLVYRYRQYGLAVVMAFFYTLLVSDSFFWISEIPQGVCWMFLLIGLTMHLGQKGVKLGIAAAPFLILVFLTIFTHFVIIIPTVFLWIYIIADKQSWGWSRRDTLILSGLLVSVIGLKFIFALSGSGSGDGPHLRGVTHVSFKDIYLSYSTPVVRMFLSRCAANYWGAVLVFFFGLYGLFRSGKKLIGTWVVLSAVGYIIIMGLTYGGEDEHVQLFHIESEWMSLGVIVATAFVFCFLPQIKPVFGILLIVGLFVSRVVYIGGALPEFRWRIAFQEKVLSKMKEKNINKLALYRDGDLSRKYMIDWAAGYESTLMSSMNGEQPRRTFIFADTAASQGILAKLAVPGCVYLWDVISLERLNHDYFTFDTVHQYRVMTYDELMK